MENHPEMKELRKRRLDSEKQLEELEVYVYEKKVNKRRKMEEAFHQEVRRGNVEAVCRFLEEGVDIDAANEYGRTALYTIAAWNGNIEIVDLLLKSGANIDAADEYGQTALILYTMSGNIAAVHLLLEKGAHINAANKTGITALHHASNRGNVEIVRLLLTKGANINASAKNGQTALHWATCAPTSNGMDKIIRLLWAHGINIDAVDENGFTALEKAEDLPMLMRRTLMISELQRCKTLQRKQITSLKNAVKIFFMKQMIKMRGKNLDDLDEWKKWIKQQVAMGEIPKDQEAFMTDENVWY